MTERDYEPVIGLEVHVQLKTRSKLFCPCPNEFGAEPNRNTCPVCLGLPGSLPVLNREALRLAVKVGLALGSEVAKRLRFDRKNYFYPDLPKAYQISQYDMPVNFKGRLAVKTKNGLKQIGITRAHLEEDAGKLLHEGIKDGSLVDYNRAGVPLLEIVSEPDLRSPEEARAYLTLLKAILQYLEVSDCDMEKGSLRCDANISIRPKGEAKFGTKVEIKNMNSFRAAEKALEYEIQRQIQIGEEGGKIIQETRLWNETRGETFSMRSKEYAHDYRYFPEPDLVPFTLSREEVEEVRKTLPELPTERAERFIREYEISDADAFRLVEDRKLAAYYEACVKEKASTVGWAPGKPGVSGAAGVLQPPEPEAEGVPVLARSARAGGGDAERSRPLTRLTANWVLSELLGELNAQNLAIEKSPISPQALAGLIRLIADHTISGKIAKDVLPEMLTTGKSAEAIVREKGLRQVTDAKLLEEIADRVIQSNPRSAEDYRAGKKQALGHLVGQIMRETKGRANPKLVNEILEKKLKC